MKLPTNSSCADVASRGSLELPCLRNSVVSVATEDRLFLSATALGGPVLWTCVAYHFSAELLLLLEVVMYTPSKSSGCCLAHLRFMTLTWTPSPPWLFPQYLSLPLVLSSGVVDSVFMSVRCLCYVFIVSIIYSNTHSLPLLPDSQRTCYTCEIHRLGDNEFFQIDWFPYMTCNSVKSLKLLFIFLFSVFS